MNGTEVLRCILHLQIYGRVQPLKPGPTPAITAIFFHFFNYSLRFVEAGLDLEVSLRGFEQTPKPNSGKRFA